MVALVAVGGILAGAPQVLEHVQNVPRDVALPAQAREELGLRFLHRREDAGPRGDVLREHLPELTELDTSRNHSP